jgi:hypothetical protein
VGIGFNSSLVVAAETSDRSLTRDLGYKALMKSKDYVRAGLPLPTIDEMPGLSMFHWTRARGGRFPRLVLQHATIAHVVTANGYKPDSTVLIIDRFHSKDAESMFLIKEYLHARGFKIPECNIMIWGEADQSIPIVNYADLIAFQIGLQLNERYRKFHPQNKNFMVEPYCVPFDERRVGVPLGREGNEMRDTLEQLLEAYKAPKRYWESVRSAA